MFGSQAVDDLCKNIARHLNCLQDENRNTRRRALEAIRKEISPPFKGDSGTEESLICQRGFQETVLRPLLRIFADPVEKCRELAITTVDELICTAPEARDFLQFVVPTLVQRLGQQEVTEPSEELRLKLIQLACRLVDLSSTNIAPYLDDLMRILQRTIVDPFPEVKKESCQCASKLARSIPQHFHMQSESLIKPLLQTISHQHSRVRVTTIVTIGDVIQYGNGKSVDDVVSHLAQRLFDPTPAVRAAVIQVVGGWLLNLLDRYSFHHKLIPLLLTGVTDEMPEIRCQAEALWHDVGMKYASENENDLKDKMDFVKPDPSHYPTGVDRPNLGCRVLVYHNFSKILTGLIGDLGDWVVETRVKSAQLLYVLLLNDEDNVTQHLEKLLTGLNRAAGDDEQRVVEYVLKSAEMLGYFVRPEIWCKMVLQNVKMSQSASSLAILGSIIHGSERSQLQPFLVDIMNILTDPGICHFADSAMQRRLLSCVSSLIDVMATDCNAIGRDLFAILISVIALHRADDVKETAERLLDRLALSVGCGDSGRSELFIRHTSDVLRSMEGTYESWSQHSTERLVFDTLVLQSGPVVGTILDDVIPIFRVNLHPDKDAEVRSKFFTLLSRLVIDAEHTVNSSSRFGEFSVTVVRDMIIPNCVWRAGRTASAVRKAAIACLWALVKTSILTTEQLLDVMEELLTQLRSTLEDDNRDTRLLSCRILIHLFTTVGRRLDQDRLHNIYPDLLKRLDDGSDDVRVAAAGAFSAYLACFGEQYNVALYRAHLEAIYAGLLIHLDDPDSGIQTAVLETLKSAAHIAPDMLLKEVDLIRHKHRSTTFCDQLTQFIHSLPKPDDGVTV
jgi:dynein assembly factor 5